MNISSLKEILEDNVDRCRKTQHKFFLGRENVPECPIPPIGGLCCPQECDFQEVAEWIIEMLTEHAELNVGGKRK